VLRLVSIFPISNKDYRKAIKAETKENFMQPPPSAGKRLMALTRMDGMHRPTSTGSETSKPG
jgi:hypothetical protein